MLFNTAKELGNTYILNCKEIMKCLKQISGYLTDMRIVEDRIRFSPSLKLLIIHYSCQTIFSMIDNFHTTSLIVFLELKMRDFSKNTSFPVQ